MTSPSPSSRKRRVTISDVAESLGMAKGTVSRALNDYSDIAEQTRTRVKSEAERMGYSPLALAQAIRTGRARSIGLVFQEDEDGGPAPFLAEFIAGVSTAVSERGWTLTVATAASFDDVLETQSRLVSERKADGFILPRSRIRDLRVENLQAAQVPFVIFGREPDGVECAWFDIAGEDAMQDAVRRLAKLGHSRIGFIPGSSAYIYSRFREQGYRAGLKQAGLAFDPDLVADSDAVTPEQGESAGAQLLNLERPPTAIICSIDRAALGVYRAAVRTGISIGSDLSVIGYDGIPEGEFATPPLTTYSVDRRYAGARLATILMNQIADSGAKLPGELAPAQLIQRESVGPCSRSSEELAEIMSAYKTK